MPDYHNTHTYKATQTESSDRQRLHIHNEWWEDLPPRPSALPPISSPLPSPTAHHVVIDRMQEPSQPAVEEGAGGGGAPAQLRSDGRHEGGGGALANAPLQPRGVDLKEEKLAPLAVQREPRGVLWGVMWCVVCVWCVLVCGVCTWGVRGMRRVWGWVAVRVCV